MQFLQDGQEEIERLSSELDEWQTSWDATNLETTAKYEELGRVAGELLEAANLLNKAVDRLSAFARRYRSISAALNEHLEV